MRQIVLILGLATILASGATRSAFAQPAQEVTEYELAKKKSVTLTGYGNGVTWHLKKGAGAGAGALCSVSSVSGSLVLDNTNCSNLFVLKPNDFNNGQVTATDNAATVALAIVSPKTEVGVDALGEGTVTLTGYDAGAWTLMNGMSSVCPITVGTDRVLMITRAACAGFFSLTKADFDSTNVIASMTNASPANPKTLALGEGGKVAEDETPTWDKLDALAGSKLYYFDSTAKVWVKRDLDNLKKAQAKLQLQPFRLYAKSGGTLSWWTMAAASTASATGGGAQGPKDYTAECRAIAKQSPDANLLCFQHDGGWQLLYGPTRGAIMRPNTSVLAVAFVASGTAVKFELDGDKGLAVPKFDDTVGAGRATATDDNNTPAPLAPARQLFAPRKPGVITLTVSLAAKPEDKVVMELTVETSYAGAIRLGVGSIFGGGRDRTYTALTLPGSGQAEITTSEGGAMDTELVLGAAAFLDPGGRTYVASSPTRWAPYFGIGILNQTATGFELLKSVHLGAEYEVSRHFSIAVTLVGRKVTRLADGLDVGDPIDASTVPTRTGYELGVGVVVNVSPEFLKLAKSPGTGFFK